MQDFMGFRSVLRGAVMRVFASFQMGELIQALWDSRGFEGSRAWDSLSAGCL